MKPLQFVLAFSLICSCAYAQQQKLQGELAKHYVAYFALKTAFEYQDRVAKSGVEYSYAFEQFVSADDISFNYRVHSLGKYLDYYVFSVYDNSVHSSPYKLGIDSALNIIKFTGFTERLHADGDTSAFVEYNDSIKVNNLNLYLASNDSIDNFVSTTIKLTQFEGNPKIIKLVSNEFVVSGDTITGKATTEEELARAYRLTDQNRIHKVWQYTIPNSGFIKFNMEEKYENPK